MPMIGDLQHLDECTCRCHDGSACLSTTHIKPCCQGVCRWCHRRIRSDLAGHERDRCRYRPRTPTLEAPK